MTVGTVTEFEYDGTAYEVPVSQEQRREFADDLADTLESLDGVEQVYVADATMTWDGVTLEVALEQTDRGGRTPRLVPDPRSLSPRLRNAIDEFTPASSFEILHTPVAKDADRDLYEDAYYIADVRFY